MVVRATEDEEYNTEERGGLELRTAKGRPEWVLRLEGTTQIEVSQSV
jgi:hypothetical protein